MRRKQQKLQQCVTASGLPLDQFTGKPRHNSFAEENISTYTTVLWLRIAQGVPTIQTVMQALSSQSLHTDCC
jgi:hypothetical protein